jgi:hypothetical protein
MPRTLIEPHKGDKRHLRRKAGKFTSRQTSFELGSRSSLVDFGAS